jgi:hypothetical protein
MPSALQKALQKIDDENPLGNLIKSQTHLLDMLAKSGQTQPFMGGNPAAKPGVDVGEEADEDEDPESGAEARINKTTKAGKAKEEGKVSEEAFKSAARQLTDLIKASDPDGDPDGPPDSDNGSGGGPPPPSSAGGPPPDAGAPPPGMGAGGPPPGMPGQDPSQGGQDPQRQALIQMVLSDPSMLEEIIQMLEQSQTPDAMPPGAGAPPPMGAPSAPPMAAGSPMQRSFNGHMADLRKSIMQDPRADQLVQAIEASAPLEALTAHLLRTQAEDRARLDSSEQMQRSLYAQNQTLQKSLGVLANGIAALMQHAAANTNGNVLAVQGFQKSDPTGPIPGPIFGTPSPGVGVMLNFSNAEPTPTPGLRQAPQDLNKSLLMSALGDSIRAGNAVDAVLMAGVASDPANVFAKMSDQAHAAYLQKSKGA